MRKVGIAVILTAIIIQGFSQEISAEDQDGKKQRTDSIADENTKVIIGKDLITIENSDSTFDMRIGDRGLSVLESLEGPKFKFEKYEESDEFDQHDSDSQRTSGRSRFKGHWAGVEVGLNSYLTSDMSFVMPDDIDYMTLHSNKSSNFNINFAQLSLGLTRHIGFVTGLGLNWNNYRFDGDNNIIKGTNGVITELVPEPGTSYKKSKLTTLYLNLPFMLEFQVPVNHNHINIAAGPIGAVKISSHNKIVFPDGEKVKSNDDFSLNMLRCGATARIGYENFQIYSTYYMTPLFKSGKGPGGYDLYPFEIGLAFTFND
ncbi:MAG: outer membrane beta-barrel protein [Bacteroidales bacterium]|nr:outer membrane beta-barrel protein [Bacteroidales bacterium]